MSEKFSDIYIVENEISVIARNKNDRVLFKYGKGHGSFSAYRSHRMTDDEKEFCTMMFKKFCPVDATKFKVKKLADFFDYNNDDDVFCS
jgi:hypothetical protein